MILTAGMAVQRFARETTVNLPALITRDATFLPKTIDEEKRTVDLVFSTGARVLRGFWDRYWEELSLDPKHVRMKRLNNGAPFLNSHDGYDASRVPGVVVRAWIENGKGYATVRFAKAEDDPEADRIFRKVKDGILQNVSVGYATYKMEKVEDGVDKIPVYRAVDWEPYEISVVGMGADDGAGFRSANPQKTPCVFITRQQETATMADEDKPTTTSSADKLEETVAVAATNAARDARINDAKARAEGEQRAADEAVEKERARISGIQEIAMRSNLGDAWAATLIKAGVSVEKARAAAFAILTKKDEDEFNTDGTVRTEAGDDERDKFIRGASAWLYQRTGTREMLERAKAKHPKLFEGVSFDPGEFRGYAPCELARICLERGGVKTRGMDRMHMIGLAFTQRTNYQTIGDFPTLLENVLGKISLGAYLLQANTWQRIAKIDEVPDFRSSNRYRTGSFPGLDVIAEHQEYKNGAVPDGAKYPVGTQRMGKMFGLSREVIINDDMGALADMATKLGEAAQRSLENAVYALINANGGLGPTQSDSQPFFHSNRANVNATGSALTIAGIDADATVLANQKDPSGLDFIDLQPAVLLVPRALRGTALQVNEAQFDPAANKLQVPNMVRGMFREVVASPRITGTRRYIIADPLDWIVVAFLEGYGRGPVFESQEGWRIDGVEWKVTLYAKPQMGDAKAAVTNAGT